MTQKPSLFWDYTNLAASYDMRADYNTDLLHQVMQGLALRSTDRVLEVGAGTGKLTQHLVQHASTVIALEPNAAMRAQALSKHYLSSVQWLAGSGERLPLRSASMALVAYGSSFNVLEPMLALDECARVLQPQGHWLALWNHRDLCDSLQQTVEQLIRRHLPDYDPGSRRQSPIPVLERHGSFTNINFAEQRFTLEMPSSEWLQAWNAHATLQRQAGTQLPRILADIAALVEGQASLCLPYWTRVWTAQKNSTT